MLVVGDIGSTYPKVVAHDFGIDGEVVVCHTVPIGPVQRSVGRCERLVEMLVGVIVFLKRFSSGIRHLEEVVATRGESKSCHTNTCDN